MAPEQGYGTLPLQIRADFLKSAVLEDRNEIRLLKNRIYQMITLIPLSSFAITAFLTRPDTLFSNPRPLLLVVDFVFLLFLWMGFVLFSVDLYNGRKCLEGREEMIRVLGTEKESKPFDVYPNFNHIKPKIADRDLYWPLALVSAALVGKLIVVWLMLH